MSGRLVNLETLAKDCSKAPRDYRDQKAILVSHAVPLSFSLCVYIQLRTYAK